MAERNLKDLGCLDRVELVRTKFLPEGVPDLDLIAANLPYVTEEEYEGLEPEVKHEPREALVAGPTGLEMISELIQRAPGHLKPGGWLVLEMGYGHAEEVRNLLAERGFTDIRCEEDYGGIPRVAAGRSTQ